MKSVGIEQSSSASVWKASDYELSGGVLSPDFIEARPDARWVRSDPFQNYRAVDDRSSTSYPHLAYAKLADMAEHADSSDEETMFFHQAIEAFVHTFGLLGWFGEEFGPPLLPKRAVGGFVRLAPDTIIDGNGRLRSIDPATEGKRLQERLLLIQDRKDAESLGLPTLGPSAFSLNSKELVLPSELRFRRPTVDFVRTGFSRSAYSKRDLKMYTYEHVRCRYGIRVLFDPEYSATGVVVLSTREPVSMWQTLTGLGEHVSESYLNRQLDEVSPLIIAGEDGGRTAGWACPSLMKAVHLMHYLDLLTRVELKKCQAPGCPEYFRVGPHSRRDQLYCPPPPGRRQSKCASRASSAKYRERQRKGAASL